MKLKILVLVGPDLEMQEDRVGINTIISKMPGAFIIGGSTRDSDIEVSTVERILKSENLIIGQNTKIVIFAHGHMQYDEHNNIVYDSYSVSTSSAGKTLFGDYFADLQKLSDSPLYLELKSCHGHGAHRQLKNAKPGTVLVTNTGEEFPGAALFQLIALKHSLQRYDPNLSPEQQFLNDLSENYETKAFSRVENDGHIIKYVTANFISETTINDLNSFFSEGNSLEQAVTMSIKAEKDSFLQKFPNVQDPSPNLDKLTNEEIFNYMVARLYYAGHTKLTKSEAAAFFQLITLLTIKKFDINYSGYLNPVFSAIDSNNVEFLKAFLIYANLVKIENNICSTLFNAVERGNVEIIKLLLDKKANPNITNKGQTCLERTILTKDINVEIVELLLKAGANPNLSSIESPLHLAVVRQNSAVVGMLIDHGANPNIKDKEGNTPLYRALYHNSEIGNDIAHQLLKIKDINVNIQNNILKTSALHLAIMNGNIDVVNQLIKKADLNVQDAMGDTPLLTSIKFAKTSIAKMLIDGGANLEMATPYKMSPLHTAVIRGNREIISYLIAGGANPNSLNGKHETPLMMALLSKESKEEVVYELLKSPNINLKPIQDFINDSFFSQKDAKECNVNQLKQLLNKDISPSDLKIILKNQRKISDLSSLLDNMKEIGLKPDDPKGGAGPCGSGRSKRAAGGCLKEEETFRYDPLEEKNLTPEQVEAHRYAEMIDLAATWELTKHQRNKHKKLQKAVEYHRNIGDVINEGQDNWSTREKKILDNHHKYNHGISAKGTSLLQEIHHDSASWHNHKVRIYDNGKSSLLVFKAPGHFRVYSSDLDYQRLYRMYSISNKELNAFIDAFFMWKEGNSNYKLYSLSKNIPHETLEQIRNEIYHPKKVQSDYKILEMKKDSHNIGGLSLETIRDVFALDNKPIDIEQLTMKFFKLNHERITLRVDKLHEVLPYLDSKEQQALSKVVAKYDIEGSRQKDEVLDEHTSKAMDLYSKEVIKVIKVIKEPNSSIDLNKLSELSWSSLEKITKDHKVLGEELGGKVIENTKSLHTSFSTIKIAKEVGTQGLFFLPSIIKAVNTNNYYGLAETGAMVAGDAAINKLVGSLAKFLPAGRVALLSKLPITSPIFKALTIYSIVELHKELNASSADAPQIDMIKHELFGQYATLGLICAEALGLSVGPAWFVLIGTQLIVGAQDFREIHKLDVPLVEALGMSLGFGQDKLNGIMEERGVVVIDLASPQASKAGYTIVQLPKVEKIAWLDVQPESIPLEQRDILFKQAEKNIMPLNSAIRTAESPYYKVTLQYDRYTLHGSQTYAIIVADESKPPEQEWQSKIVYLSPTTSKIAFGEYSNTIYFKEESNNWFLNNVEFDEHVWARVPQLLHSCDHPTRIIPLDPFQQGPNCHERTGPTANIPDPISLYDTGYAALYINQQVVKKNHDKLNHIHFAFDPRRGDITLDITKQGLISMDNTNRVYLQSVGNNRRQAIHI